LARYTERSGDVTGARPCEKENAYVEVGTGDLYRIPKEALLQGSSPLIHKESTGASRLVQLSANPFITTLAARMLACEHNSEPNF